MIVVVTGTGRCGTHTLYEVARKVDGVIALHEGKGYVGNSFINVGDLKAVNIYERIGKNSSKIENIAKHCLGSRLRLLQQRDEVIFDINRMSYRLLNLYNYLFDDVKFVHLVRNGYNCVKSWLRRLSAYPDLIKSPKILRHYIAKSWRSPSYVKKTLLSAKAYVDGTICKKNTERLNYDNQLTYSLEKPKVPDSLSSELNRLEKISWFWQKVNNIISSKLRTIADHKSFTIKIENFDYGVLCKLLADVSVECPPNIFEFKKYDSSKSSYRWDDVSIKKFNCICADLMKSLGYDLRYP